MSKPASVILVSGQTLFAEGLRALLVIESDLEVAGEAASEEEAFALLGALPEAVVLVDLDPPLEHGLDLIVRLLKTAPASRPVAITAEAAPALVVGAFQAGAVGFLLKTTAFEELSNALRAAAVGEGYLQPGLSARVLGCIARRRLVATLEPAATLASLTCRETEILELLARGQDLRTLPALLGISLGTVRNHLTSIHKKLGARDCSEAVEIARMSGLACQM